MIPPGGIMLLLFWLFSAIMIPFSVIPYEAKISTLRFGCYIGAYWAAATLFSRLPRRKMAWMILLVLLLAAALYSVVQHKIAPSQLFGMERYADYGSRLGGTYICPNHIAHLFQMWIPFCLVFLFLPQLGWFWRICCGYALPVFLLLIYQTQSRAGLLGVIASGGVLFLMVMLRRSRKAFLLAVVVAPLLMAIGVGGLWAGSSIFRNRMQPVVKVASSALSGDWDAVAAIDFRPMTWFDTMVMVQDRPLCGVGPGNYGQTFPEYRNRWQGRRLETVHPHNEPIELITEYGVVGTLLFVGALIGFCIPLIRLVKNSDKLYHALPAAAMLAALAGTLVHGLFDFELRIFPNALMLSVLAGCAVAPLLTQQKSGVGGRRSEVGGQRLGYRPLTFVFRLLFSVGLLLAAVWAVQVMISEGMRVQGDRLRLSGERQRAEAVYKKAVAIDPQNWRADLGLGQIYTYYRYYELEPGKKEALAQTERDFFAQAYHHNTKKEEVVYGLGRAELALGNRAAGLDYLRQAAHYKRFNDFYWRKLGIELRKAGLYEEAMDTFLYAQKLERSNPTVKRNIQWLKDREIKEIMDALK
jgi:O-antigen ligase